MTTDAEDDLPHQPLISDPDSPSRAATKPTTSTSRQRSPWLLVTTAGLSGLLFGYDTGIISSTLLHLPASFPISTTSASLITSAPSALALFSAPLSAPLADVYGRRPTILLSCVLFVLGALVQAFAPNVVTMVAGRAVVGAAIGGASSVVPMYIGEIARPEERGRLVTVQSLFITGGQVVAYLVGWATGQRWRVAVGLGAVPALVQGAAMGWLVESPRFLVARGRDGHARDVLEGHGVEDADAVVGRIREEVEMEGGRDVGWKGRWRELVGVGGNRRALGIACLLQGLQQLCGFNVLMYFSATIFALVGFSSPVTTSLSIAGTNFLFTLAAFTLIDSVGRRRILLISIPFMVVGLALCAVCFIYLPAPGSSGAGVGPNGYTSTHMASLPLALLLSLVLYVAAYALGLGCVPWQQSELFPLKVRSLGSGLATATNWSSNFVIGITFLPMMDFLGSSSTFALYGIVCFVGWFLVYLFYPETAGLELEDVGALLADGWGVRDMSSMHRRGGHVRVPSRDQE